jgi:osmotically-inducible protein OsmY
MRRLNPAGVAFKEIRTMNDHNRGYDRYEQDEENRGRRMTGMRDESYGDSRGRRGEGQWDRSREWNGGSREWNGGSHSGSYQGGGSYQSGYPGSGYQGGGYQGGGYQGSGYQGGGYQGGGFQDRGSSRSWNEEGGNGSSYLGGGSFGQGGSMGQSGHRSGMGDGRWNQGSSRDRGFAGRGPKDYQRSDERIREDVNDRLTDDSWLDASEVTVEVKNGEVTLAGTVEDREQKRRAEDMAEQVSGVREVRNNIRVDHLWHQSSSGPSGSRQSSTSGSTGSSKR